METNVEYATYERAAKHFHKYFKIYGMLTRALLMAWDHN